MYFAGFLRKDLHRTWRNDGNERAHLVRCISFFLLQRVFFFLSRGKVAQFYLFFLTEGAAVCFFFFPIGGRNLTFFFPNRGGTVCVLFSFSEEGQFGCFFKMFSNWGRIVPVIFLLHKGGAVCILLSHSQRGRHPSFPLLCAVCVFLFLTFPEGSAISLLTPSLQRRK